jgi:hypothetical protein
MSKNPEYDLEEIPASIPLEGPPIEALNEFFERKHSPELDELKETLNKGVDIMIELMDDETGLPLHIFAQAEDSSILNKKAAKLDKKRRREIRNFQEWLEKFGKLADSIFEKFSVILSGRIESIKTNAEKQIEVIDNALNGPLAASGAGAATIAAIIEKKSRLKNFVKRLSTHSENLGKAENTEQLLEIEATLEEDVTAFDNNTAANYKMKGMAAFFSGLFAARKANIYTALPEIEEDPYEYDFDPYNEDSEDDTKTSVEEELTY